MARLAVLLTISRGSAFYHAISTTLTWGHVSFAMAIRKGATDHVNDEQSNRKIEDGVLHAGLILTSNEAIDTENHGLGWFQKDEIDIMNSGLISEWSFGSKMGHSAILA